MMVQNRNVERSEKEIEEILKEASEQQKKQMDAEGIFASEELIAVTMQKLEQVGEENAAQQAEKDKPLRQRVNYKKQLGRIALLVAAAFAIVLAARGGMWVFYGGRDSKGFDMDGAGMFQTEGDGWDSSEQNGFPQDSLFVPEAVPTKSANDINNSSVPPSNHLDGMEHTTDSSYLPEYTDTVSVSGWNRREEAVATVFFIETATYFSDQSGKEEIMAVLSETEEYLLKKEEEPSGLLMGSIGIKPQLFYENPACSALKIIRSGKGTLQIVFDYPQDFLYSCGREEECLYLLATRKMPSGGYEHQLLLFDFEAGSAEALPLSEETDSLLAWISLQDGNVAYECEY